MDFRSNDEISRFSDTMKCDGSQQIRLRRESNKLGTTCYREPQFSVTIDAIADIDINLDTSHSDG